VRIVLAVIAIASLACSRDRAQLADAASIPDANTVATSSAPQEASSAPRDVVLDETCRHHDDCVAVLVYPDGDLRCCLACGAQRAANKTSADAFVAMCAHEREMKDCPVYDCQVPMLDARCVAKQCVLVPPAR
jgi:hypothetical protein